MAVLEQGRQKQYFLPGLKDKQKYLLWAKWKKQKPNYLCFLAYLLFHKGYNQLTLQLWQKKASVGIPLTSVFLRMISVMVVFLISATTSAGQAYSYQNLSPSLILLNCSPAMVAPNSPNIESGSLISPSTPTQVSMLSTLLKLFSMMNLSNQSSKISSKSSNLGSPNATRSELQSATPWSLLRSVLMAKRSKFLPMTEGGMFLSSSTQSRVLSLARVKANPFRMVFTLRYLRVSGLQTRRSSKLIFSMVRLLLSTALQVLGMQG